MKISQMLRRAAVGKPFAGSIEQQTEENTNFRKVLQTGKHAQLVVMNLKGGEKLDPETHSSIDQFFRIEEGKATFVLGGARHRLGPGGAVVIPAGMKHEVINASPTEPLKVYTVYSPPNHPEGTVDKTLADAKKREQSRKAAAAQSDEDCPEGQRWCPVQNKCIPGDRPGLGRRRREAKGNDQIKTKIRKFFKANPYPNDDKVHDFADQLKISPHDLETSIYALLSDLLKG